MSPSLLELVILFCGHVLAAGQSLITHGHSRWRSYLPGDDLPENIIDVSGLLQFAIDYNVNPLLEACLLRLETGADLNFALMTMRRYKRSHPLAYEAHKRLRREWIRRFVAGDEVERTLMLDCIGII